MVDLLADSKQKLTSEKPKKAFEFAMVIPNQLAASDDALKIAEESVKEAARQLKSADGTYLHAPRNCVFEIKDFDLDIGGTAL